MKKPPALPLAPRAYDPSYLDQVMRSLTLYLREASQTQPLLGTQLTLTDLVGSSLLNANILAGDTSLTLDDASRFPTSGSGTINAEKFSWDGKTGNTLNNLTRGIVGTTAAAHTAGDVVVASAVSGTVYAHPTTNALYVVF